MKRLIEALLNDDHGISEEAYNALADLIDSMLLKNVIKEKEYMELHEIIMQANGTDGRFYIPEE